MRLEDSMERDRLGRKVQVGEATREIYFEDSNWIKFAYARVQGQAFMMSLVNLQVV